MPDPVKVLIVESQPVFSRGLVSLIQGTHGYLVIGEALNSGDALKLAKKLKPKLVILDIALGKENALNLITQLKAQDSEVLILVLSMHDERFYSERVLRLGARGYIMKDKPEEKVIEAVNTVVSGKVYLSEIERERIFEAMAGVNPRGGNDWDLSLRKLSNRELQIFTLMGKGLGTLEIASRFNLSTKTIDTHKEHIKQKLHCNTSLELRQLAIEWLSNPDDRENYR
ncbi:MAG: response regulator transcription factor [Treponema sp.]|nr:response regulator transcription factor [Treponema sp.]